MTAGLFGTCGDPGQGAIVGDHLAFRAVDENAVGIISYTLQLAAHDTGEIRGIQIATNVVRMGLEVDNDDILPFGPAETDHPEGVIVFVRGAEDLIHHGLWRSGDHGAVLHQKTPDEGQPFGATFRRGYIGNRLQILFGKGDGIAQPAVQPPVVKRISFRSGYIGCCVAVSTAEQQGIGIHAHIPGNGILPLHHRAVNA